MLSHLCRISFWLAALAAALALLAPAPLGTGLTVFACIAVVAAWAAWRAGLAVARREAGHAPAVEATGFSEPARLDIALRIAHAVEAAGSFDAALLGVAQVLKSELGLRDVRTLRVAHTGPDSAELAELIDGRTTFCTASRRVRLDPSSVLGRALLHGQVEIGPEGGAALPVCVDDRTVAVLELGAPAMPLTRAALASLLTLAQLPLSRRGSQPAPPDTGETLDGRLGGCALHDNAGVPNALLSAMSNPPPPLPHEPAPTAEAGPQAVGERLDPQALARLAELDPKGDNQLVPRVLRAFVASSARLMPQLDAAGTGPDLVAIRYVVHTLKSSSASIGALGLSATCAEIEALLRGGQTAGLAPLLGTLSRQMTGVLTEIGSLLGPQ